MLDWASGYVNLFSYAASFGDIEYHGRISSIKAMQLLKRFDAISVRENSGIKICNQTFGVNATKTIDPTLLFDQTEYNKLIDTSQNDEFVYPYICGVLLKKENRIKFRDLNNFINLRENYHFYEAVPENKHERRIEYWLKCIKNADYIIADSYHGTVFSIIFHKEFVSIADKSFEGGARIPSLLKILGISSSRIIDSLDALNLECFNGQIDWNNVDSKFFKEKQASINFIKKAMSMNITWKEPVYESLHHGWYTLKSWQATVLVDNSESRMLHFVKKQLLESPVYVEIHGEKLSFNVVIDNKIKYINIEKAVVRICDKPIWYNFIRNSDQSISISIGKIWLSATNNGSINLAKFNKSWEHFWPLHVTDAQTIILNLRKNIKYF